MRIPFLRVNSSKISFREHSHYEKRRRTVRDQLRLERLEERTTLNAGDLDTTFGNLGIAVTKFDSSFDDPSTMLVQSDGKVIVVGLTHVGPNGSRDLALARYLPDGSLDSTFGQGGHAFRFNTSPPGGYVRLSPVQGATTAALLPNGKIQVASDFFPGNQALEVLQLNADGTNDQSFGTNGVVTLPLPLANARFTSMIAQPDGKVVLAGGLGYGTQELVTMRLTTVGGLDSSYDGDGYALVNLGAQPTPERIAIDASGRVIVAGQAYDTSPKALLARFNSNGSLDTSFAGSGWRLDTLGQSQAQFFALTLRSSGQMIVSGISYSAAGEKFLIAAQYNANGSLDAAFGSAGFTQLSINSYYQTPGGVDAGVVDTISVLPGGDLLLASGNLFAKLTSNGSPISSYGRNGNGIQDLEYLLVKTGAVAQSDGSLMVYGSSNYTGEVYQSPKFARQKLLPSGLVDNTYGVANGLRGDAAFTKAGFEAVTHVTAPNGKLVVAGSVGSNLGDFGLVRYNTNGSFDTTFSDNSWSSFRFPLSYDVNFDFLVGATIQPDGKTVFGGVSGSSLVLRRYLSTSSGYLDGNFSVDINGWWPTAIGSQPDGKILVIAVDNTAANTGASVLRFNSNGSLDLGFGTGGFAHLGLSGSASSGWVDGLVFQPDGMIVAAINRGGNLISLVRLTLTGSVDTAFGTAGVTTINYGGIVQGFSQTPDGKLILGAADRLYQFLPNGQADAAFASGGYLVLPRFVNTVAADPDGKLLVADDSFSGLQIVRRFLPNGSVDTQFGVNGIVTIPSGNGGSAEAISVLNGRIYVSGTNKSDASQSAAQIASLKQYNDAVALQITPANSTTTATIPTSVTIEVKDAFGQRVGDYTGRVRFTSSDPQASLPADTSFNFSDRGLRTFSGIVLRSPGVQTVTASDTVSGAILGNASITVQAIQLTASGPAHSNMEQSISSTVVLRNSSNDVVTDYRGTVRFTSDDPAVSLPADTTFTAGDAGSRTFSGIVLRTPGQRTVTITDLAAGQRRQVDV